MYSFDMHAVYSLIISLMEMLQMITSVCVVYASGAIMVCDQRYNMKVAVRISKMLGRRQRLMMLLLRMLFCNPRRTIKAEKRTTNQYSVR